VYSVHTFKYANAGSYIRLSTATSTSSHPGTDLSTVHSSTVHIYIQTTQDKKQTIYRTTQKFWNSAGHAASVGYTLAFALQLTKKHRKT
jgi:transketolase N-terminal domain/subunit